MPCGPTGHAVAPASAPHTCRHGAKVASVQSLEFGVWSLALVGLRVVAKKGLRTTTHGSSQFVLVCECCILVSPVITNGVKFVWPIQLLQ